MRSEDVPVFFLATLDKPFQGEITQNILPGMSVSRKFVGRNDSNLVCSILGDRPGDSSYKTSCEHISIATLNFQSLLL